MLIQALHRGRPSARRRYAHKPGKQGNKGKEGNKKGARRAAGP